MYDGDINYVIKSTCPFRTEMPVCSKISGKTRILGMFAARLQKPLTTQYVCKSIARIT